MSGIKDAIKNTVHSGEPGSTGREVFEDSTASGPPSHLSQSGAQTGSAHGTGGRSSGVGSEVTGSGEGHHGHHHHHHHHSTANEGGVGGNQQSGLGSAGTATEGGALGSSGAYAEERRLGDRGGALDTNSGGFTGTGARTGSSGLTGDSSGLSGTDSAYTGTGSSGLTGGSSGLTGANSANTGTRSSGLTGGSSGLTGTESGYAGTGSSGIDSATLGSGAAAGGATSVGTGQEGTAHHHHHHQHKDRVGAEGQNQALYEGGSSGPVTGGAAGTDRFDTDKNVGYGGSGRNFDESNDTTRRAEGKGTGGIMGVLGTTDKDFTGRDRLGQSGASAYTDDQAKFSGNTTGPGGSALTGREGNIDNNPVAQAQSRAEGTGTGTGIGTGTGTGTGPGTGTGTGVDETETTHKKGLMEKIKDATGL